MLIFGSLRVEFKEEDQVLYFCRVDRKAKILAEEYPSSDS